MDLPTIRKQKPHNKKVRLCFLATVLLAITSPSQSAHADPSTAPTKGSFCLTDNEILERNDSELGGSYLTLELPNPIDTATSINDFTIASWLKITKINPGGALVMGIGKAYPFGVADSLGPAGFSIHLDGNPGGDNGYFSLGYADNGQSAGGSLPQVDQWFHLAVVRHSGVITIYKDGISFITLENATSFTSTTLKIGVPQDTISDGFPGCYSGLVQANSALYTSDFSSNLPYPEDMNIPPSAQVLLNPDLTDSITAWNKIANGPGITKVGTVQISSNIPVPRILTYNTNGAEGTAPPSSSSPGSPITLPLGIGLSKSGYDFGGWSVTETGTAETSPFTPLASRTLYAVWTFNEEAAAAEAAAQAAAEAAARAAAEAAAQTAVQRTTAESAAINREVEKQNARAEIVRKAINKQTLSTDLFEKAEIPGVTAGNLALVEAEIHALPDSSRSELNQIMKIARKYEVVGLISSDRVKSVYPSQYIEIGLISADSKIKSTLVKVVSNLAENQRSSYEAIKASIDSKSAEIQARKDRLLNVLARQSTRNGE